MDADRAVVGKTYYLGEEPAVLLSPPRKEMREVGGAYDPAKPFARAEKFVAQVRLLGTSGRPLQVTMELDELSEEPCRL